MINSVAKQILYRFKVNKFIETGTYQGDTLMIVQDWFCDLWGSEFNTGPWEQGEKGRARIYSVEINKRYFDNLAVRWQKQINVELYNAESVTWLNQKIDEGEFKDDDSCFFFLDAHQHESDNPEPLRDEISAILRLKNKPIISIDDWAIPQKSNDIYSLQLIRDLIENRTNAVYYSNFHNFHGKYCIFIFVDRNEDEIDQMLDQVFSPDGVPILKQTL